MDFKDYQVLAKRTCVDLATPMDDNIHMLLGMHTEVGELTDAFKRKLAYNKDIDLVNIKEELGDIIWYIANFCRKNNLDMNEILLLNVNKLKKRFPNNFKEEDAVNRDLAKEREALEEHFD